MLYPAYQRKLTQERENSRRRTLRLLAVGLVAAVAAVWLAIELVTPPAPAERRALGPPPTAPVETAWTGDDRWIEFTRLTSAPMHRAPGQLYQPNSYFFITFEPGTVEPMVSLVARTTRPGVVHVERQVSAWAKPHDPALGSWRRVTLGAGDELRLLLRQQGRALLDLDGTAMWVALDLDSPALYVMPTEAGELWAQLAGEEEQWYPIDARDVTFWMGEPGPFNVNVGPFRFF